MGLLLRFQRTRSDRVNQAIYAVCKPIGWLIQRVHPRAYMDEGGIWTFQDLMFKGEDFREHALHPLSPGGIKLTLYKKAFKRLIRLKENLPAVIFDVNDIKHPDALFTLKLGELFEKRINVREGFVHNFMMTAFGEKFDTSDTVHFNRALHQGLAALQEADPYYRDTIFDYQVLIFRSITVWTMKEYEKAAQEALVKYDLLAKAGKTAEATDALLQSQHLQERADFLKEDLEAGPMVKLLEKRAERDLEVLRDFGNAKLERMGSDKRIDKVTEPEVGRSAIAFAAHKKEEI